MLAPKPAFRFTAYAIGRDPLKVRYDGAGTFSLAETGTALVGEAWITSAVEPQRFVRLRDAHGQVTGREEAGRPSLIAEVQGLRGSTTMRLWVDEEGGCIVRVGRGNDPAPPAVRPDRPGGRGPSAPRPGQRPLRDPAPQHDVVAGLDRARRDPRRTDRD